MQPSSLGLRSLHNKINTLALDYIPPPPIVLHTSFVKVQLVKKKTHKDVCNSLSFRGHKLIRSF